MTAPTTTVVSGSDRARLAHLALEAALAVPGVRGATAGLHGVHMTSSGGSVIAGVLVVAEPGGRFSVDLGLRAELVPLHALADAVRARVAHAAERAGSGALLGAVGVTVHDVVEPA